MHHFKAAFEDMLFKLVSITQFGVIPPTCPFRRDGSHLLLITTFQKQLVRDPTKPAKYATVLVDRDGYRAMTNKALHTKKDPATVLQQAAIDLVFSNEVLINCSGLGYQKKL